MSTELDVLRRFRDDITVSEEARADARALMLAEIAREQRGEPGRTRRPRWRMGMSVLMVTASVGIALAVVTVVVVAASNSRSPARSAVSPPAAQPLLRVIGVLRRPQTPADLDPEVLRVLDRTGHAGAFPGSPVRSLIRLATVTSWGEKVFLVPFRPPTASTTARLPPIRRRAVEPQKAFFGSADRLGLFAGGVGCCATASVIEQRGTYAFGGRGGSLTAFVEVVPDGVAKVSLLVPRQDYPRGPISPHPLIVTANVHANVFAVQINQTIDDLGTRQIWYGPAGTVIKRIGATSSRDLNRVVLPPRSAPPTALSRRAERDPSTPNPVSITPSTGGPHTTFTVRFRALLNDGSYLYRLYGPGGNGCHGRAQLTYGWVNARNINAVRGHIVTNRYAHPGNGTSLVNGQPQLPNWCPGTFRVTISASTRQPEGLGRIVPFGSAPFTVHP